MKFDLAEWVEQLVPDQPACVDFTIPESGQGIGLTEAARGALGHWIEIRGRKISNYQCVVPTTWNCSPRDDRGRPGAMEIALVLGSFALAIYEKRAREAGIEAHFGRPRRGRGRRGEPFVRALL